MPISSLFCFHLASLFLFGFFSISIFLSGSGQAEERLVTAPGPEGHLAGIHHTGAAISEGKKDKALVIIVPGSGPTDKDGNSPLGLKTNSYKYLAQALGKQGIASVRIDKRGMFASKQAIADANKVRLFEYGADLLRWVHVARKLSGLRCVWIAGHSEGGLAGLIASGDTRQPICGLILLAAPGRPLANILKQQFDSNPANALLLDDAHHAIDRLAKGERVDVAQMHPALQQIFAPSVQGYLIDVMGYDPAEMIEKVTRRVLILQGEEDLQVSVKDAERLHEAQPKSKLVILPRVNHILKDVPSGDKQANLASYANPDLPLAPSVADAIVSFIMP